VSDPTRFNKLVISAPFGNYIQPAGATPTLGTFTRLKRPGRVWRILKTVRRYKRLGAWVNKIGLRNPGIDWLEARVKGGKIDVSDKLVSVHGFTDDDWWGLLDSCVRIKPMGVELNISCPNVGEMSWPSALFARAVEAMADGIVVVKLPPVRYERLFDEALKAGVRTFHCCNTLPVPGGGMSGKPLMPVALACIGDVLRRAQNAGIEIDVIGGGGITSTSDIDEYAKVGAKRVAIGTKVMHPKYLRAEGDLRQLIDHADRVFASG